MSKRLITWFSLGAALALLACAVPAAAQDSAAAVEATAAAQAPDQPKPSTTIYGFAMLDFGSNFKTIDPNWFDTMRITKLPSYQDQFGKDGSWFAGVRQSRFGVKSGGTLGGRDYNAKFEIDMFGTGVDAGQTTIRLRYAYGEWGSIGAGQTDSPFEDENLWPNTLEYWGPTGMVYFRNVQVRWTPVKGDHTLILALERPGASGDAGVLADRVELQNVKGRYPLPDFTGAYKYTQKWGYVRAGWALRQIKWDDLLADQYQLSGSATGWGFNLSSCLNLGKKDVLRLSVMHGEGVENYMQDSPVDVGIAKNPGNAVTPVVGKPLPITGTLIFLDHTWNSQWTSSVGYSMQDISNSDGQAANAFHQGYYAVGNLLYSPVSNVMMGGEFQWGRRTNFSDGWKYDGYKVQFAFKYAFSHTLGGK
jgi:hypothetical protein